MIHELTQRREDLLHEHMLLCDLIKVIFQCKENTALLLSKMYHFILSDHIKILLTLSQR